MHTHNTQKNIIFKEVNRLTATTAAAEEKILNILK